MNCPKCGHAQDGSVRCDACGVYFAKLQPAPPPQRAREASADAGSSRGLGAGALFATALVTGTLVFLLMRDRTPAVQRQAASPTVPANPDPDSPARTSAPGPAAAPPVPARTTRSAHPLEAARRATVFIRTEWGLGSGFIVSRDCHVITNRHVVETDGARVAGQVLGDPETRARIANAEQQLRLSLQRDRALRRALARQPGTNLEQIQLDQRIKTQEGQLADLSGQLGRRISDSVEGAGRKGFTAMLVDGKEFRALHATLSDRHDLAYFQLPAANCEYIAAGDSQALGIGDRLYTVGNPSGITYTVTSGVYSGSRVIEGLELLQTDAPISSGNSGGPLITENGEVVGINTLVLRGVPGVGFAIPIEIARQEFGSQAGLR
jgi:S1-C subfamily serine protease